MVAGSQRICPEVPRQYFLYRSISLRLTWSRPAAPDRSAAALSDISHASLILCTHAHTDHLDPGTVPAILASTPRQTGDPKAVAEYAHGLGISYRCMVTTDSGLRVEYLDDRIYSAPSAHNALDWTPLGGYPYLGYLVRFGNCTIYHAGDGIPYPELADRLRPYNITVALVPISGRKPDGAPGNFEIAETAQLAEDIGAPGWSPCITACSRRTRAMSTGLSITCWGSDRRSGSRCSKRARNGWWSEGPQYVTKTAALPAHLAHTFLNPRAVLVHARGLAPEGRG